MHLLHTLGSFALVLGVLVFIHELGHYLAARWRGIYVEAFSIGFGPALLSWTDRRETVWKLCVLPLGGFVKMHGMALDVGDEQAGDRVAWRKGQAFFEKSVASRAIVVAAGPIANFLLAAVLYSALFASLGQPVPMPVVGEVEAGSAAAAAGLKPGDDIVAVNGVRIADFDALRRIVVVSAGRTLALEIHRPIAAAPGAVGARAAAGFADMKIPVSIKPASPGDPAHGLLGVTSGRIETRPLGLLTAIGDGCAHTGEVLWQIVMSLVHIVTSGQGIHELGGPIAIATLSGQEASLGIASLVGFIAMLSINLGLVNLLPIPILDGGHLVFYAAEALRGRPLPDRAQDYSYRVGFALIASMFLFISWNDLVHAGAVRWVAHLLG